MKFWSARSAAKARSIGCFVGRFATKPLGLGSKLRVTGFWFTTIWSDDSAGCLILPIPNFQRGIVKCSHLHQNRPYSYQKNMEKSEKPMVYNYL